MRVQVSSGNQVQNTSALWDTKKVMITNSNEKSNMRYVKFLDTRLIMHTYEIVSLDLSLRNYICYNMHSIDTSHLHWSFEYKTSQNFTITFFLSIKCYTKNKEVNHNSKGSHHLWSWAIYKIIITTSMYYESSATLLSKFWNTCKKDGRASKL